MGRRAAVVDAVAALEFEKLAVELELNVPGDDDEQLLGVAVGVGLGPSRPTDLQLAREDLEVMERSRREEHLPAEDSERKCRALVPPEHPRARPAVGLEQVGHRDAERAGDPPQRRNAGGRLAALDLA